MNKLSIILCLFFAIAFLSCSDDKEEEKTFEGYAKVELGGTSKCTSGETVIGSVKEKRGTIVLYKGNLPLRMNAVGIYIKDENGKYYCACGLRLSQAIDGEKIIFSGIIYETDQAGGLPLINPLGGVEFGITDLWVEDFTSSIY